MMKLNRYGIFAYGQDENPEGPKHETLAEHKEHCKAKEGNCPFEKNAAAEATKEDTESVVQGGAAPSGAAATSGKTEPGADLPKTAKMLEMALVSAAKSVGEDFLDKDLFSVVPSMTWDPLLQKERPTGGFTVSAAVHGGAKACDAFLNKLHKALGITRKKNDCYPGEKESRINTHITADEAKNALVKLDELKAKAAEKAQAAAEAAKAQEADAKRDGLLQMATAAVTMGAKTVNFHVAQGDFAPEKAKIDAAMNAKGDVEALLKGEHGELNEKQKAQAEALQKALGEINDSYFGGKHTPVGMVPQMEKDGVTKKDADEAKKINAKELSDALKQGFATVAQLWKASGMYSDIGIDKLASGLAEVHTAHPEYFNEMGLVSPNYMDDAIKEIDGKLKNGIEKGAAKIDLPNVHQAVLNAAKTINYHIEQGDYEPNPSKIKEMMAAAKKLHDAFPDGTSDNSDAAALLGTMKEIAASGKAGWKTKIGFVKPLAGGAGKPSVKSGVDFMKQSLLHHKKDGATQTPSATEAQDAYLYDANRWAHMAAPKSAASALKEAADALSLDDAHALLNEWGYPVTTGAADLEAKGFPAEYAKKVSDKKHKAATGAMFNDSVKCAAVAIQDLQTRFPNMLKPHLACLFPSVPKSPNCSAEWVKGDEKDASYSSICFHADYKNTSFGGEYSYGHTDSRLPFDIFRHEYMHAISTGDVAKQWKQFVADTYGKPCTGFFKLMGNKVSGYAASGDIYEAQAEIFAKMTSYDYKPGTLPRPIEDFFYGTVMGAEPAEGGHQHLMHDPNKKPKETPKPSEDKTEDVSVDDFLSWFAPEKTAAHAPALEKVLA